MTKVNSHSEEDTHSLLPGPFVVHSGLWQKHYVESVWIDHCIDDLPFSIHTIHRGGSTVKPWPHRTSESAAAIALTLVSMLGSGYEADAWCGLSRYKSMWAITSLNTDARCG